MKNIIKIFTTVFLGTWILSCSPEEHELKTVDVSPAELVEGIAFKIEHDPNNPNIIYLTSLMDSRYTPLWDHPQGRSQENTVTLQIPFEGEYQVKFGVQTRGGVVYGEPTTFTIDQFYAGFVDHELWTFLTGGVGNSKTWIHDNGEYGLATGEMDYADPTTTVEWGNFTPNWSPGKGHTADEGMWNSTMTFSLQGGANVAIHDTSEGGVDETGTFMLDVDNHTITLTDAEILHPQGWDFKTTNWAKGLKILTLTENHFRVAVFRELVSGEGEWWMIFNYVSKEYADNYVPEELPDPVPEIDGDANDILTTTKSKTWVLSADSPYDWADLNGGLLNNFTGGEGTYLATGWAAYNAEMIAATKFTFSSGSGNSGTFIFSSHDSEDVEGEYTIDENNDITFDQPLSAVISESDFGWTSTMSLNTTSENKLRILKTETDALGLNVTEMWLGQRSTEKDEYMVFHFVLGSGTTEIDPVAAWKNALAGKTFKPDVNWFINWVGFPPDFTGGWTSTTTFGDDFTTNNWVWDANVRAVAESASLTFRLEGSDLKVDLSQTKNGTPFTATGDVVIDGENNLLNISIPLIDYEGTVAAWLNTSNPKSVTGSPDDWYIVPHGGSTVANLATNGLWLGTITKSVADGDDGDEILIFHYVLAE